MSGQRIVLVEPCGFCAGVKRAVVCVEDALRERGAPLYCYRELVHNRQVIGELEARGVVFVTSLDEVPAGATLIFSAHGVAPGLYGEAQGRGLRVIDATCPFVAKIHRKVRHFVAEGRLVLLVGHRGHDEVNGVLGEAPGKIFVVENAIEAESLVVPAAALALVTQTTLSVAEVGKTVAVLRRRFPALATMAQSDICHAVRNRQLGVRRLVERVEMILVLGAANSSNTLRLVEVARAGGAQAALISTLADLAALNVKQYAAIGVTAGASTPESFVQAVIAALQCDGQTELETLRVAADERVGA